MDWLQFIASIIGSALAWPSVIIALLFILRKQISSLAERIEELAFWGAKMKFARAAASEASETLLVANTEVKTLEKQIAAGEPKEVLADTTAKISTAVSTANNAIQPILQSISPADWETFRNRMNPNRRKRG
jgi:hypothetical protein